MKTSIKKGVGKAVLSAAYVAFLLATASGDALAQKTKDESTSEASKQERPIRGRIERLEATLKAIEFLLKHDLKGQYERIERLQGRIRELDKGIETVDEKLAAQKKKTQATIERLEREPGLVPTENHELAIKKLKEKNMLWARTQESLRDFYLGEKRTVRILLTARQKAWKDKVLHYPELAAKVADSFVETRAKKAQGVEASKDFDKKAAEATSRSKAKGK